MLWPLLLCPQNMQLQVFPGILPGEAEEVFYWTGCASASVVLLIHIVMTCSTQGLSPCKQSQDHEGSAQGRSVFSELMPWQSSRARQYPGEQEDEGRTAHQPPHQLFLGNNDNSPAEWVNQSALRFHTPFAVSGTMWTADLCICSSTASPLISRSYYRLWCRPWFTCRWQITADMLQTAISQNRRIT